MFEREIRDAQVVKRWGIVRTIRDQTIADHQHMVTVYTNDLCVFLRVDPLLHLAALQYAMWHDTKDEIFSGDMPGPSKRAMVVDRAAWDKKADEYSNRTFGAMYARMGVALSSVDMNRVKAIVKCADWLDAACEMGIEKQLGNCNVEVHLIRNTRKCLESATLLCNVMGKREWINDLKHRLTKAVKDATHGQSLGPVIADPEEYAIAVSLGLLPPAS